MAYTFTATEVISVRSFTFAQTTTTDLPDATINSEEVKGAAADYVMGEVLRDLDITLLSGYSSYDSARSASVDTFVGASGPLTALQREQFRRAVVYRAAGIAVTILAPYVQEGTDEIVTQRRQTPSAKDVQAQRFAEADEQIALLRSDRASDAFLPASEAIERGLTENEGAFFAI